MVYCCASVCRVFSVVTVANVSVFSVLYGATSDFSITFVYNARLPGTISVNSIIFAANVTNDLSQMCYRPVPNKVV